MLKMGERIKRRRESLNIQTNELAKSIGLTSSLISQIEKAKAFPSVFSLKKIADALQTTVGDLIGENDTYSKNPVVKFEDKKFVQANDEGTAIYLLSNHEQQKLMEPHLLVFPPLSDSKGLINHIPGQIYYYVINGCFSVDLNSDQFTLNTGDSLYLNSTSLHSIVNTSTAEAMLICISANPSFS